ncbi:MAG: DinB family protein [Flammeovirgaceae bacterium]
MSYKLITPPDPHEYSDFYAGYVRKSSVYNDLMKTLPLVHSHTQSLMKQLPSSKHSFRYAPNKWSIKELMLHLVDSERVFAYRALRIARHDKTPLHGFDENKFVENSFAENRTLSDIMEEFRVVREASIKLFEGFEERVFMNKGIANEKEITVRALGYIIIGHELHHIEIIKERYL